VRPICESSWFAGKVVNDNEFDEERGQVEIGSLTKHPSIVYSDANRLKYYFSPIYLNVPFYIDLKGQELGIKTK